MKRIGTFLSFLILVLFLMVVFVAPTQAAQSYSFQVPELRMQVYVQPDASARIVYDITFSNSSFGHTIDIVDIGTPHDDYDISNMSASLDGVSVSDIRVSEYVSPGVEVHLGGQSISAGQTGTLHFEFTMLDMVYGDTTNKENASLQITPTWFDDQLVTGSSDVWVLVHMLPEVTPDEVLYQDVPFTDKVIFEDHVVAVWRWPDGQATGPNPVGVSFPQRGMTRVIQQSLVDIAVKWLEDNPSVRFILGTIVVVLFTFAFLRFSGGTGITLWFLMAGGIIWLLASSVGSVLLALPLAVVLVGANEMSLAGRKGKYLPAIAQVEGGGIKRGLTAPEAAVLLELPLNKVLLLVLFGLLEKGVVRAVSYEPLELRVAEEFDTGSRKDKEKRGYRLKVAQDIGIVLRDYEHIFLDTLARNPGKTISEINFSPSIKSLITHTAERLKGFDLSDTQDYYKKIVKRALDQAKRIGEIPELEQYIDRHMQWLMIDDAYPTVFSHRGYHYRPIWVRPFASADRMGIPSGGSAAKSIPTPSAPGGKTSFGDVAASFAGWTENTAGKLASSILPGSLEVNGPGGIMNLSGVDKVTGDIFKALGESSSKGGGSSSGGGSSCACACAGCACACACAGGGR
ncbi:MAG: hypothetical protein WAM60_00470 [Candidatus Promineifilaceae bacterium]